jgi:glycerol-3-phosphate dehydrogenase (NAD(P)+)
MATITILGAGVMGSAMAFPASDRGHRVRLVGTHLDRAIIDSVKEAGFHPRLGVKLPPLDAYQYEDFGEALGEDTDLILLGVSSAGIGWVIEQLIEQLSRPIPLVMITKGLFPGQGTIVVLPDYLHGEIQRRCGLDLEVAAIGGPCIAGELAVRRNTGVVITSKRYEFARRLCEMFVTSYYHPRPSSDVTGVEICAAFKNFFAIAVGYAAGSLERLAKADNGALNHNAAAILFDQALIEMMMLSRHFGGQDRSVWGMPGAGDLYVTCQAGRNSRLGRNLGHGLTYREIKAGVMKDDTIEGAELGLTLAPVLQSLTRSGAIDAAALPVTRALLETLVHDKPVDIAWNELHAPKEQIPS